MSLVSMQMLSLKTGKVYVHTQRLQSPIHVYTHNGLPMGGSLSPSLANIYLGVLERKIISQYSPPILFYRRYMDDLLFILTNNPPFIDTF
jgi:retron-type reverse transcriptase